MPIGSPSARALVQEVESKIDFTVIPGISAIESKLDQWNLPAVDDMLSAIESKIDLTVIPGISAIESKLDQWDLAAIDEMLSAIESKLDNTIIVDIDDIQEMLSAIESKIDLTVIPGISAIESKLDLLNLADVDEMLSAIESKIDLTVIPDIDDVQTMLSAIESKLDLTVIIDLSAIESKLDANLPAILTAILAAGVNPLNYRFDFNNLAVNTDEWLTGGTGGFSVGPAFVDDEPSLYALITAATSANIAFIHGNEKSGLSFTINEEGKTTVTFEARIKFTSVTLVAAWLGLLNPAVTTVVGSPPNSVGFNSNFGNWLAVNENGAAETTDTGVAPTTNWTKFKIVWDASDIKYYIDDVLKATHSTPANFPLAPVLIEIALETGENVSKTLYVDYVDVEVT